MPGLEIILVAFIVTELLKGYLKEYFIDPPGRIGSI
jgi:hypothetical protein